MCLAGEGVRSLAGRPSEHREAAAGRGQGRVDPITGGRALSEDASAALLPWTPWWQRLWRGQWLAHAARRRRPGARVQAGTLASEEVWPTVWREPRDPRRKPSPPRRESPWHEAADREPWPDACRAARTRLLRAAPAALAAEKRPAAAFPKTEPPELLRCCDNAAQLIGDSRRPSRPRQSARLRRVRRRHDRRSSGEISIGNAFKREQELYALSNTPFGGAEQVGAPERKHLSLSVSAWFSGLRQWELHAEGGSFSDGERSLCPAAGHGPPPRSHAGRARAWSGDDS